MNIHPTTAINNANFYSKQGKELQQPEREALQTDGQGSDKALLTRQKVVFTNGSHISKALADGKITVDGVSIDLSEDALRALSEAQDKLYADREAEAARYMAEFSSYAARRQQEMSEDTTEDMAKALETARRIARGDIVPAIDEKKLLEYDAELYQIAKNAAMLHAMEEHRKDKSLYEEKEEKREYTDPEAETEPIQKYGVELEVSLGETPAVTNVTEGPVTE
ncbi:MAG: hypothetical protein NC318_02525 [Blautia sp.]|nr:hypothetical protein [Blautia sp.]